MENTLQYRTKEIYGTPRKYPANQVAECFAKIEGNKTLSESTLSQAFQLGYVLEQVT